MADGRGPKAGWSVFSHRTSDILCELLHRWNPLPVTRLRAHRPFHESPDPDGGWTSLRAVVRTRHPR